MLACPVEENGAYRGSGNLKRVGSCLTCPSGRSMFRLAAHRLTVKRTISEQSSTHKSKPKLVIRAWIVPLEATVVPRASRVGFPARETGIVFEFDP